VIAPVKGENPNIFLFDPLSKDSYLLSSIISTLVSLPGIVDALFAS